MTRAIRIVNVSNYDEDIQYHVGPMGGPLQTLKRGQISPPIGIGGEGYPDKQILVCAGVGHGSKPLGELDVFCGPTEIRPDDPPTTLDFHAIPQNEQIVVRCNGRWLGHLVRMHPDSPIWANEDLRKVLGEPFTFDGPTEEAIAEVRRRLEAKP